MDNLIRSISKFARLAGIVLLLAATAFSLIVHAAGFPNGFMPVIGNLLLMVFDLLILGSIPVLLLLKKDAYVKYILAALFGYWLISNTYSFLGDSDIIVSGNSGLTIARGLFEFFIALCLLAILVFIVLFVLRKKGKLLQLAFCVLVGSLVFFVVLWGINMGRYAKFDYGWTSYLYAFRAYLFVPIGLTFLVLDYLCQAGLVSTAAATADGAVSEVDTSAETIADVTGSADAAEADVTTDATEEIATEEATEETVIEESAATDAQDPADPDED